MFDFQRAVEPCKTNGVSLALVRTCPSPYGFCGELNGESRIRDRGRFESGNEANNVSGVTVVRTRPSPLILCEHEFGTTNGSNEASRAQQSEHVWTWFEPPESTSSVRALASTN